MDFLKQGTVVRLCSLSHKMYLIASEDEEDIMLSRDGSSKQALWTAEVIVGKPSLIRLRSCFTQKYLAASEMPSFIGMTDEKRVIQYSPDLKFEKAVEWAPLKDWPNIIKLRTHVGSFLSINEIFSWSDSVVHLHENSTLMRDYYITWIVDVREFDIESKVEIGSISNSSLTKSTLTEESLHEFLSELQLSDDPGKHGTAFDKPPQLTSELWGKKKGMAYNDIQLDCLAYCSVYPKDHRYVREILVNQWLAEGFFSPSTYGTLGDDDKTLKQKGRINFEELEKLAYGYFNELLLKGVFQSPTYAFGGSSSVSVYSCVMNPIAYEKVRSVASKQVAIFDRRLTDSNELPVDAKYVSFHKDGFSKVNAEIASLKFLKATTLFSFSPYWGEFVPEYFTCIFGDLRVLDLSGCLFKDAHIAISFLPNLKYLALSRNRLIQKLIINDNELTYLQTLAVDGCVSLEKFDLGWETSNLRHLYLTTNQRYLSIQNMRILRILELSHCPELTSLSNIECPLRILRIFECPCLGCLESMEQGVANIEEMVLHNCANLDLRRFMCETWERLKYLELIGLPKLVELPDWLETAIALEYILISKCNNLSKLTDHVIKGLKSLQKICIYGCPLIKYLPKLLFLLPSLLTVDIRHCPGLSIEHLSTQPQVFLDGQLFQNKNHKVAEGNDAQTANTCLRRSLPYFNLEGKYKYRRWKILAVVVKAIVRIEFMLMDLYKRREEMKLYCCLFPNHYEFERDKLVQLWMAMGFLGNKSMEAVGNRNFDILLKEEYILTSRIDVVTGKSEYRVNVDQVKELVDGTPTIKNRYLRYEVLNDEVSNVGKTESLHVSVVSNNNNHYTLEKLLSFRHDLRSLLFIGSSFLNQISGMFSVLKSLEALDLSGSDLIELPSSIGNLKQLRYLDVSFTLLERLPESIEDLRQLQTLKLRGCKHIHELPKDMKKLINLRHLDFDILGQLTVMPKGIGALTQLRTLSAFVVDAEEVCSIQELKNMNYLSGSCCISGLDNVHYENTSYGEILREKKHLSELQLRWSDSKLYSTKNSDDASSLIKYNLVPSPCLENLQILYYPGNKLPYWIGRTDFKKLFSITFLKCENKDLEVSFGDLPSLKYLNIIHMDSVRAISNTAFRRYGSCGFPRLEKLVIDSMFYFNTWSGVEKIDFPLLSKFVIKKCPALKALPFLPWLRYLQHLEISECTLIKSLGDAKLSPSVQTLIIDDCPLLKERCSKGGADWDKIEHVPNIWIDFKDIHNDNDDENSTAGAISDDDSPYCESLDKNHLRMRREELANKHVRGRWAIFKYKCCCYRL